MGFLGKLFGGGSGATIENLRKAVKDNRFVDARLLAETLASQSLMNTELEEVEQLRTAAGDGLARLNLDEAIGLKRCGRDDQADEHFQLALEQVCSADLRAGIEELMAARAIEPEIDAPETESPASCLSCSPGMTVPLNGEAIDPGDQEYQLELILTSYPSELVERYHRKGEIFQDAFLLSHAGNDEQALPL
ncbi:MAG: hypothetical protein OQK97_00960, partial [Deltaproteobacteria bacterium]|nr:hypothetical protein [Deltaproteobacteria bacterium]